MQCVVADWKASAGHVPDVPVHVSATSHWPAEARHVTVAAWYTSTHALLVPVQWSAASSSHAPPCELPVQSVLLEAKAARRRVVEGQREDLAGRRITKKNRDVTVAAWDAST